MDTTRWLIGLALGALAGNLLGCGGGEVKAHVDRTGAQATTTRPVSTEVPLESIPYDPRFPKWVLVVEPFVYAASGVSAGVGVSGTTVLDPGDQIGPGASAQLVSRLSQVGNVILVDWADYQEQRGQIKLQPGEIGPFIIRGAVTEWQEKSDESTSGEVKGPSPLIHVIPYGIGGIIASGVGTKSETQTRMEGMVAIDLRVVDSRSKRVVASFPAAGSFVTYGASKSRTSFNTTRTSVEYAASAIGQAERQAMNNAIHGIHDCLARSAPLAPATQMAER